jgi:hypothetical protein
MRAMPKMKLCVAAALLASATAHADGPTPGQEVLDLKAFSGNWNCIGKAKDGSKVSASLFIGAPRDLGGFWYDVKFNKDKSKDMPAFAGHGILGFDTANRKYYFTGVDSMGGWVVLVGSMSNKVLDLSGNANLGGQVSPFKFKFDASGKKDTLVFQDGPNLEDESDCRK